MGLGLGLGLGLGFYALVFFQGLTLYVSCHMQAAQVRLQLVKQVHFYRDMMASCCRSYGP